MKNQKLILVCAVFLTFPILQSGCAKKITLTEMQSGYSLLSEEVKKEIKQVEKSIVGVNASIRYEIQTFDYIFRNGKLIPDKSSPFRYKLKPNGIVITRDEKTLSGGGIVLDRSYQNNIYTILTSSHLAAPKDTVDIFYTDVNGVLTDILFQRRIVKNIYLSGHGQNNMRFNAALISHDPVDDIALIFAKTEKAIATEFHNEPGYDLDLTWGDWTFLFGYPKEVKQMTGGWVSESPYRGTFAVDAVVRYGFSGGPVFALSKNRTQLVLVGMIKSVPSSNLDYIAPQEILPPGYNLNTEDLNQLVVKKLVMVEYGTTYCVGPKRIQAFLKANEAALSNNGIRLHKKYL